MAKSTTSKKAVTKKSASKKAAPAKKKAATKTNRLGVKNSLVNNINARKEKGVSRPKSKGTVSKAAYKKMEDNWGKDT